MYQDRDSIQVKYIYPPNCCSIDGFKVELIARLVEEPLWYTTPAEAVKGLFELSDLIELACFYENIYYPDWVSSLVQNSDFFQVLARENVLRPTNRVGKEVLDDHRLESNHDIIKRQYIAYQQIGQESLYLSTIHNYIEEIAKNLYFYPSICYSQIYFQWINIKESLRVYNQVYKTYRKMTKKFGESQIERRMLAGYVYPFYIPPLTELILRKARFPFEIADLIIEWRKKLEKPRNLFNQIIFLARDPSISNKQFKKEKSRMDRAMIQFLKDLYEYSDFHCRMAVHGSQALSGIDLNNILDSKLDLRDFNFNKIADILLKKAIENIYKIWRTRQIKIFYTLRNKFKNLNSDIEAINQPWEDTPIVFTPELLKYGFELFKSVEDLWSFEIC